MGCVCGCAVVSPSVGESPNWRMVHFFANTLNFSVFAKMQNSAQFRVNSAISTAFYFVK